MNKQTIRKEVMKLENLKIGDVVKIFPDNGEAYDESTVINKTEKEVTFFRPYVNLANFTYTGGVIPFIGIEKYSVPFGTPTEFILIQNIYRGGKI